MNAQHMLRGELVKRPAPTSSASRLLGWQSREIDHDARKIRLVFQARPEFMNPIGTVHGGFLSAMLDEAMGNAIGILLTNHEFAPTVELKINFVRPAYPGLILAEAYIVYRGISLVFLQGELRTAEGQLIATGTATAQIQRVRQPRSIAHEEILVGER